MFRLIIEAISQYSNLILTDSRGTILEAMRRISAEQNRSRVTLPRHPYIPPPSQRKRPLDTLDEVACAAALAEAPPGSAIWQSIVSGFGGLGPLAAREIAFRALGEARGKIPADAAQQAELARRLATAGHDLIAAVLDGTFSASIARDISGSGTLPVSPDANGAAATGDIVA